MKIHYIKHDDIDFVKWDKLIDKSICPLIYGYSWYLDGITNQQWDALVYGNYEAVFPLPSKRKYGIKYIYQPYFCQQLGLFAKRGFLIPIKKFIDAIPSSFVLVDLNLNIYLGASIKGALKKNYQLDLNRSYNEIFNNYSNDVKNNLCKISKIKIEYQHGIPYEMVIEIQRKAWGALNPGIKEIHYKQFIENCKTAQEKNQLITLGAILDNELIGAALFFITPLYLFYTTGGITAEGKKYGIMHGILNNLIQQYSNKPLILDFEGSEIEEVAYFYDKFGSQVKPYLHFKAYNFFK